VLEHREAGGSGSRQMRLHQHGQVRRHYRLHEVLKLTSSTAPEHDAERVVANVAGLRRARRQSQQPCQPPGSIDRKVESILPGRNVPSEWRPTSRAYKSMSGELVHVVKRVQQNPKPPIRGSDPSPTRVGFGRRRQ